MYLRATRSLIFLILLLPLCAAGQTVDELRRNFVSPPDDSRMMMRWWWFGSSVTKAQLEREMQLMKEGGIGGVEIQPVYALLPDDEKAGIKNLSYLSPEFLDALKFTADKSKEMGLRFDLTLGSGWSFGGAKVPMSEAAGQLRVERIKVEANARRVMMPTISAVGETLIAAFLSRGDGQDVTELKDIRDGVLSLPEGVAAGSEVLVFISGRSGMQVKRPAVGGEGYVLNHIDAKSAVNYLKNTGDPMIKAVGENVPFSVFCDSLEVYNQDWTDDFLSEFQKRRGYDLRPHLPALISKQSGKDADVRYDWARTITELFDDRFMKPMVDWSHKNKTKFRIQGYGIPPANLASNASADISDGEGAQWKVVRASRWAASANHIYGRPVTSSETWTWLHSPVFRATPLDLKAEADVHFLQGINQLIGHGWPYTSEGVEYPGWRFYAAGVYNEKNPWWIVMPDLAKYMQRMSYVLRQGKPANDVAVYLPNADAYAHFSPGKVHLIEALREHVGETLMPEIFKAGYNLDFIDDGSIQTVGKIEKDHMAMGDGKYRIIVLPNVERIPPATIKKFEEFVKSGGILIATRRLPAIAPGVQATAADQQIVKDTVARLFQSQGATAKFVGDEKTIGAVLNNSFAPDVALPDNMKDVAFVRRKTANSDVYFVVNTSNVKTEGELTFRITGGTKAEVWNPVTGVASSVNTLKQTAKGTAIQVSLAPYESTVITFAKSQGIASSLEINATDKTVMDLTTDWKVTVGSSAPVNVSTRRSWADDEQHKYYSGTAVYEKSFAIAESTLARTNTIELDFGQGTSLPVQPMRNGMRAWYEGPIREAAVIYINDKRVGSLWAPPYRIDVKGFVKAGENTVRVVVGNTAMNYMAGKRLPDYKLLNLRYGERFQPQDMDKIAPLHSGMLGSVQLHIGTRK